MTKSFAKSGKSSQTTSKNTNLKYQLDFPDDYPYGTPAGFVLLRAKSIITCSKQIKGTESITKFSNQEIKNFKKSCVNILGPEMNSLFPQTMKRSYYDDLRSASASFQEKKNCENYLNYLLNKKIIIENATKYNIDGMLKYYLSKKYDETSDNSTETIINYIYNTTYYLNIYINKWEQQKWSNYAAPGLYAPLKRFIKGSYLQYEGPENGNIIFPSVFSYRLLYNSFINLNELLYSNNNLILRLSSDIINYFLNDNTYFNTENILDFLINDVKKKNPYCYMPPSDVLLVPTSKTFNNALKVVKDIFNQSRDSELGYPDGLKITINAIETDDFIPDININEIETYYQKLAATDYNNDIEYLPLLSKSESKSSSYSSTAGYGGRNGRGIQNKSKKKVNKVNKKTKKKVNKKTKKKVNKKLKRK